MTDALRPRTTPARGTRRSTASAGSSAAGSPIPAGLATARRTWQGARSLHRTGRRWPRSRALLRL
eukprot:3413126-Alexandrium_andersonii.AAC.1